jgi:hypothetical protein
LRDHGDVIEADLAQHYPGFDVCDMWRGKVTLRKVGVYIDGLPSHTRTAKALSGGGEHLVGWSLTDILIGRLHDEVAAGRWQYESSFVKEMDLRPQPKPIVPSGRSEPETPTISPSQIGQFLNGGA